MKWKPGRPQILVAMGCITTVAMTAMLLFPAEVVQIATIAIAPLGMLGMKLLEGE